MSELTIADLALARRRLAIYCTWADCHRHVSWAPAKAVRLLGPRATFDQALRRLRCSECGARGWGPRKDVSIRPDAADHYSETGAQWRLRHNYDTGQEKQPYDDYWLGVPDAPLPPEHLEDGSPPPPPLYGDVVCNDYRVKIPPAGYVEGFSQLELPFKWATGGPPNLEPRDDVRIKDTAPVVRWTGDAAELTMMQWAWDHRGRPVFNFRSEGRDFSRTERVLIPADGFYEFTAPADPRQKRKDKWLFTLKGEPWFWVAGIVKEGAFTMLTTGPGPDVAPYHGRQVVVVPLARTADWLLDASPDVLRPLPAGSLVVEHVRAA